MKIKIIIGFFLLASFAFADSSQGNIAPPTSCSPSCEVCSPDTPLICYQCIMGYYLTTNYSCQSCPQGCVTCKDSYTCLVCIVGYTLIDGNCWACPKNCLACENIVNSSVVLSCVSCNLGFYAINYTIDPESSRLSERMQHQICAPCLPKCLQCQNSSSCSECASGLGFNKKSPQCYRCGENCLSCESQTGCTSCQLGYHLWVDQSYAICATCGDNCTQCDDQGQCKKCPFGYYPQNHGCLACPEPCEFCFAENYCIACSMGYFPKTEVLNDTGMNTSIINRICTLCQQNCQQCLDQNTCTICFDGYYMKNNDSCEKCGNACLTCTQQQGCVQCSGSYYLLHGQCKACQLPCYLCVQNPTTDYYCYRCFSTQYTVIDGKCMLCSDVAQGCSTCQSQNQCYTCSIGYYLLGNECIVDDSGLAAIYIVLICIAGVIGLAAIVFGVVACWKSRNGYGVVGDNNAASGGVRGSYYQFP